MFASTFAWLKLMVRCAIFYAQYSREESYLAYSNADQYQAVIALARSQFTEPSKPRAPIDLVTSYEVHDDEAPFVIMHNVMDEVDISNLGVLCNAIKSHLAVDNFYFRPLYNTDAEIGGGNKVTFLTGFAQYLLPEWTQRLREVTVAALKFANFPHEGLKIRCVEVLEYETGGRLEWHYDPESNYTMILYLSALEDYKGGDMVISLGGEHHRDTAPSYVIHGQRGDGFIFKSEMYHKIEPITAGNRYVLAVEFWNEWESVIGHLRPDPIEEHTFIDYVAEGLREVYDEEKDVKAAKAKEEEEDARDREEKECIKKSSSVQMLTAEL